VSVPHPSRLGKYAIDGVLGAGAMGVVYEATDPGIQRRVALKTIRRSLVSGDDGGAMMAARFRNEAQAAGRLTHPGIVAIYEYGEEGDTAFIAMEHVQGQDLAKILGAKPDVSLPMLLQIMDQLLSALDYAHERGVWHRDIKPANLILTPSGQLKITDFGIARIRDAALTQVTSTIGTHGYMAPEQYRGQGIDQRVDIFAAGVLLYRLLTGQSAFAGSSPESIMYKVLHDEPPAPSSLEGVHRGLQVDGVVAKALAKNAPDRYATAGAFRAALNLHATKSAQSSPLIGAALNWDDTVIDEQATQLLRQATAHAQRGGHWDEEALSVVERALASFVGPMAKMMVKQAAARHTDFDALLGAVAEHLQTPQERERFMAKVVQASTSGGSRAGASGASAATGGQPFANSRSPSQPGGDSVADVGARDVSAAFVAYALHVLTSHMGPMAKVVIKAAQAKAHGPDEFIELLIQHSAEGVDRDRLYKVLQQGLSSPGKAG